MPELTVRRRRRSCAEEKEIRGDSEDEEAGAGGEEVWPIAKRAEEKEVWLMRRRRGRCGGWQGGDGQFPRVKSFLVSLHPRVLL